MSQKQCCVPGCLESGDSHPVLHLFPNPNKYPDRFRSWVMAVGGDILGLSNLYIHANRRVCHRHFETEDCCRFNKLSQSAIPKKHLLGLHKIPQFSVRERRYFSAVENIPSSSTVSFDLFGPEFNMSHHLLQERMPSITENIENKENVTQSEHHPNIASVSKATVMDIESSSSQHNDVPTSEAQALPMDIEYNFGVSNIQMPLQNPACITTDSVQQIITAHAKKRLRKRVPISRQEEMLYKKLRNMQIKLSRSRNLCKKYAASVKMSNNIMTNQLFLKTIENMTSAGRILTLLQFREQRKKSKGRRFTLQEKITSLFIYKKSPKAYRFLRKILLLPAPQSLDKLVRKAVITPGINEKIFQQLKTKSKTMKKEDKLCILLFDEVSLQANINYNETQDQIYGVVVDNNNTKFVNHATVFMIRGLVKNYKQPIAYTFCNGATKATLLKEYLINIISKLQEAGFQVIATVCDQGTNNQKAIKSLIEEKRRNLLLDGAEPKRNTFDVNGSEIIPLYDPPHLLKGIRNNLITKNLKYVNEDKKICVAKWEHLQLFYNENPAYKGIRLVPKLTDQHIIPEKMGKMKVKFATQVFSRTVSSNMGYLADKGILPSECKETADVLLLFDKIFDSMNGSYTKKTMHGKPYLKPLNMNSAHIKLWHEAKTVIKTMRFVTNDGKSTIIPSLTNFLWTIEGLEYLIKKLSQEHNITSIWTRHLNQDPLENFFGSIRSHGCRNNNPSPGAFQSSFTALIINNLKSIHAVGSNCEEDFCESLQTIILGPNQITVQPAQELNMQHLLISPSPIMEKKDNVREMASIIYVSGFILKKCKEKTFKSCPKCNDNLMNKSKDNEYLRCREYSGRGWLCYPNENFINIIYQILEIFHIIMQDNFNSKNLKEYIKSILYINIDAKDITTCEEHKNLLIQFLYNYTTRFLIRSYCKDVNKVLCGKRKKDNNDILQNMAEIYCEKSLKYKKK